jgi:tetratricopeptide (TPR) repeat protein
MTRARYWLFMAITVLVPVLLLSVVELVLRATWPGGAIPVFVRAPAAMGDYLMPNPELGRRYFTLQDHPPAPLVEPFAAHKPAHAYRIFVLGASSAAGFPWPPIGTFSRLLQDALRDVMPDDSVEVINLAIPATNTYAVLDQTDAVIAQHPDGVLIYAGHNEYYGALGVGSTEHAGSSPTLVRTYLWLERFRTFMLLRAGISRLRRAFSKPPPGGQQAASFMEVVAGDQQITLGGRAYEAGVRQFRGNLERVLGRFRAARVPVFIASLASNEGAMHPFASPANGAPGGADAAYDSAAAARARGDTTGAERLFVRARDLDVIRFRAPSEFNAVVRQVARDAGATYVPVVEAFRTASPGGIIGNDLILEHLHPNLAGVALIGREFFAALEGANFLGHPVQPGRLKPWAAYVAGMDLTPFDRRMVAHTVNTLATRWPFVPVARDSDYRGTYRPTGPVDSLAFLASAGVPWRQAKLDVAKSYEARGFPDSAFAEYRGLVRDLPLAEPPYRMAAHALLAMNDTSGALRYLQRALSVEPVGATALELGAIAARRKDYPHAVGYLRQAAELSPKDPQVLYQLSLVLALTRDLQGARTAALQVARLAPNYPGLAGWLRTLGLTR